MDLVATNFEIRFEACDGQSEQRGFGVARVSGTPRVGSELPVGQRVLAPRNSTTSLTAEIDIQDCWLIEETLSTARAMLLPDLVVALEICAAAQLELGEVAAYTSGGRREALIARIVGWCTGRDVWRVDFGESSDAGMIPEGIRSIDGSEPQAALEAIQRATRDAPGFAAIIFSSKAEAMDVFLEAMPTWGRLVLASGRTEPATIDFYNNVHRKGVTARGVPAASPLRLFDRRYRKALEPFLRQAVKVMQSDVLATACLADVA